MNSSKVRDTDLIIIPAWNESQSIKKTLTALLTEVSEKNLLVVNDGSSDATESIVREMNVHVISHPFNLGVGAAVRTGYKYARKLNYQRVVHFDADLQHKPEEISTLLLGLAEANVVVGSRFLNLHNYKMSNVRKLAANLLCFFIGKRVGMNLTDVTSGFRASDRKAIELFADLYPTAYLADTVESLVIASDNGLRISEVSTPMDKRVSGSPSHGLWKSFLHFLRAILVIISTVKIPAFLKKT